MYNHPDKICQGRSGYIYTKFTSYDSVSTVIQIELAAKESFLSNCGTKDQYLDEQSGIICDQILF